MNTRTRSFWLWLVAATFCPGAVQAARAGPPPQGQDLLVKTVRPGLVRGRIVSLHPDGGLMLRTEDERDVPLAMIDVVEIFSPTHVPSPSKGAATIALVGGNTLYGWIKQTDGDRLYVDTADLGELSLLLDAVSFVNLADRDTSAHQRANRWRNTTGGGEDAILLVNGDVVRGFVSTIDPEHVTIETSNGDVPLPRERVLAIRLASPAAEELQGVHFLIKLRHTGQAVARSLKWKGGKLHADLQFGGEVPIDMNDLVAIQVLGGRWERLSSHTPISHQHTPMLSLSWPFVADRNVRGRPLTVAGESYERGLGVHSQSRLTYDLRGEYQEFVTLFGLDDDSGPYADVTVHILVDGKRRHSKTHVRQGTLFGPVRLDVSNAKRMTLLVDFGDNGDIQDRFDWIDPALIR